MNAPLPAEHMAERKIEWLPVGAIAPSDTELQKLRRARILATGALDELAASIRADGMHLPLIVRPLPIGAAAREDSFEKYELIAGERRWRAAQIAGLEHVPAIIRDLDDRQALRLQLAENIQRETLSALEEAEGYRALLHAENTNADGLVAIVGKSRSWIYDRLKLLQLPEAGRAALLAGQLDPYLALGVARVKTPKLQAKALKIALEPGMTVRMLKHRLTGGGFTASLIGAPFPVDVVTLYPDRGACTACPDRSGNGSEFDAAEDDPDVCTDPECFKVKVHRHAEELRVEAVKAGRRIITGPAAIVINPHKGVFVDHVALDAVCDSDEFAEVEPKDMNSLEWNGWDQRYQNWQPRTYRVLLQAALKAGESLEPLLLEDPRDRRLHELVPIDRARRLLKRTNIELPSWFGKPQPASQRSTSPSQEEIAKHQAEQEAQRKREEQETAFRRQVLAAVYAKCKGPFNRDDWEAIAEHALNTGAGTSLANALFGGKLDLAKLKDHELQRLVRLSPVTMSLWPSSAPSELFALARRYKIDPQKIKAAMREEGKPAKKPTKPTKSKSKR